MGGVRNPIRRGGGVVHGPLKRHRRLRMPRKAGRLALFSALSRKLADGEIRFVKIPAWKKVSTRSGKALLEKNGIVGKVLVLHEKGADRVERSLRNLPGLRVIPGERVNIGDLLRYGQVLISPQGLSAILEVWS